MIKLLEDVLEAGGVARRRWVADEELAAPIPGPSPRTGEGGGAQWRVWEDEVLGLFYCEAVELYRGPVEVFFQGFERKFIRVLAWGIGGDRVSKCMEEGAVAFAAMVGRWARWAFIDRLPKGAEAGVEVAGLALVECEWAVPGFVFIGG